MNFTGSTIVSSASVLHDALGSGSSLTLTQSTATADEQKQIAAAADKIGFSHLLVLEFNLARIGADGSSTPVHSFTGNVTVTLKLTDVQLAAISDPSRAKICYYDPETGSLTDMKAVFDLTGKTVTFITNHFSSYLLAAGNPPTAGIKKFRAGDFKPTQVEISGSHLKLVVFFRFDRVRLLLGIKYGINTFGSPKVFGLFKSRPPRIYSYETF